MKNLVRKKPTRRSNLSPLLGSEAWTSQNLPCLGLRLTKRKMKTRLSPRRNSLSIWAEETRNLQLLIRLETQTLVIKTVQVVWSQTLTLAEINPATSSTPLALSVQQTWPRKIRVRLKLPKRCLALVFRVLRMLRSLLGLVQLVSSHKIVGLVNKTRTSLNLLVTL